jgi:hypothetical protein
MSFIKDFIAISDARLVELQALRAVVIDAIYALFVDETGHQIFELSSEARTELQRLKNHEISLDGQIADIDAKKSFYLGRERIQREVRRKEHRQHAKKYEALAAARPLAREQYEPSCEWNCSLAGASPPWQWSWMDSSQFVPFSEMLTLSARQWD